MILSINKKEIAHYRSHHPSQSLPTKLAYRLNRQIRKVKTDYVKYQNKPQYVKIDFCFPKEKDPCFDD